MRSGVPREDLSLIETGQARVVQFGRIRAVFEALGGWIEIVPHMPGTDLARTLNAGHAAMHEAAAVFLRSAGDWELAHEVSFSIYGERGVIDILAWHAATRTLVVIELKTAIVDANNLVGSMDRRRRLAARIARERGWDPLLVACWVLVADGRSNRRRLADHLGLLRAAFPADGGAVRRWLRRLEGSISALSFLPVVGISDRMQVNRLPRRVRMPAPRSGGRSSRSASRANRA